MRLPRLAHSSLCLLRPRADPRILALISTSGSGKTRSLLELLCLRFGLFLVADTRGNGGAGDFALAVEFCKHAGVNRAHLAACVLARLLVLQHVRARGWTPAQFLSIQLFDGDLFMCIYNRLCTASFTELHKAIKQLLEQMNIQGLPIIMDEAQVMLEKTSTGESLFRTATRSIALYTQTAPYPVLIVSGTSFGLKDMEPHVASGLLKPSQTLPTMVPSPLTPDDVTNVVRKVLGSEPPGSR